MGMEIEAREALFRVNDGSEEAIAERLRVARLAAGYPRQKDLAEIQHGKYDQCRLRHHQSLRPTRLAAV